MKAPFGAAPMLNLSVSRKCERRKLTNVGRGVRRFCSDVSVLGVNVVYDSLAIPLSKSNVRPVVNAEELDRKDTKRLHEF
jgi:hypothetical protein